VKIFGKSARSREGKPRFERNRLCNSLSGHSNDPSAELDPALTHQVNFRATQALAESAKARGGAIHFLVFMLGLWPKRRKRSPEDGKLHPLTAYAESKLTQLFLSAIATSNWRPVVLRMALFRLLARMRFDLVLNIFAFMSTWYNRGKNLRRWPAVEAVPTCFGLCSSLCSLCRAL